MCDGIVASGYDAVHVRLVGLLRTPDDQIIAHARESGRTIVSADTDFSRILSERGYDRPSVILFRSQRWSRPEAQIRWLRTWLPRLAASLRAGVVVSASKQVRIRELPLHRDV